MRSIVFLTVADISWKRGDSIATRELVVALAESSNEPVDLICPMPERKIPKRVTEAIRSIYFLPAKSGSGNPLWHLKTEYTVWRYLTRIHSQNHIKSIVTRLYPSAISPTVFCEKKNIRNILLVRGWVNRTHKGGSAKYSRFIEQIIKQNVRRADEVYVAFSELREWLARYRAKRASPIQILPNAVDPEMFKPLDDTYLRREIGVDDSDFVVGFVGSLEARHALPELIKSIPETGIRALIVGEGPRRKQLELIASDNGVRDHVDFTGFVPHEEVAKYISAFDAGYGVFYPDKPSNPIKCYEYLACTKPVITNHAPELEFVRTNRFGVTLEDITVPNVVKAIEKIRSQNQDERDASGQKARKYVIDHFTWESVASTILAETDRSSVI